MLSSMNRGPEPSRNSKRLRLVFGSLVLGSLSLACGASVGLGDFVNLDLTDCEENAVCDDGQFCNGQERCNEFGNCESGAPPCSEANGSPICSEEIDECFECLTNADCPTPDDTGAPSSCRDNACVERCANDAECDDKDVCTDDACVIGLCENVAVDCNDGEFCNGFETCDPATGACVSPGSPCAEDQQCNEGPDDCSLSPTATFQIISVDFPATLQNGESATVSMEWGGFSTALKTGQFFVADGGCPEGFACANKTLTAENRNPFFIPNAFTCRIGDATEPVRFEYIAVITDRDGRQTPWVPVSFVCVP